MLKPTAIMIKPTISAQIGWFEIAAAIKPPNTVRISQIMLLAVLMAIPSVQLETSRRLRMCYSRMDVKVCRSTG